MKPSLLVVSNLGNFKAYKVEHAEPGKSARLQLVDSLTMVDAHTRISDRLTDQAGRFPGPNAAENMSMSQGERGNLEIENRRRLVKQVADRIVHVMEEQKSEGWAFAALPEINREVLDQMRPEYRNRLVENVTSDLVKIEPSDLLKRFSFAE